MQEMMNCLIQTLERKKTFLTNLKLIIKKKTLLYAPTWSHSNSSKYKKNLFPKKWGNEKVILEEIIKFSKKKRFKSDHKTP